MSFMRLLSAGKTLMGIRESHGRYRVDSRYQLPKFGSPKNPFVSPEAKPAAQVELPMSRPPEKTPEQPASEAQQVALKPEEVVAANLRETQPVAPTAEGESQVQSPEAGQSVQSSEEKLHPLLALLDWMELTAIRIKVWVTHLNVRKLNPARMNFAKLNPARLIPKRNVFAVPVVAKPSESPVQAELSLEKVRVVRNDLSDADLEIVPLKAQTKPRRETTKPEKVVEPELAGVGV